MKKIISPSCDSMTPTTKSKMFISKKKVWKDLCESIVGQKPLKIKKYYYLQFPKKDVDPSKSNE